MSEPVSVKRTDKAARGLGRYALKLGLLALLLAGCAQGKEGSEAALNLLAPDSLAANTRIGAFTYGGIWQGLDPVLELEAKLGRRLDIVHWFTNWDNPYFPEMVELASQGGRSPLISWQSFGVPLAEINVGFHDDYIREWARGAATAPGNLYLRPFPEMNGDWAPWNGNPTALKNAWRRVVNIFKEEGATNVRFVFSPNVTDEPRTEENRFEQYYPGDAYVDILALDGYNWGTTRPYIGWRTFTQIFQEGYDRITNLGNQPVWIAEFASADEGGDKAAWVAEMLATTGFERVEALIWFDEDKEADWRMAADSHVARVFREGLARAAVVANNPNR